MVSVSNSECAITHYTVDLVFHEKLISYQKLLRHVKDWDPYNNYIYGKVPAHRTAITQIDEFHTEIQYIHDNPWTLSMIHPCIASKRLLNGDSGAAS